MEFVPSNFVIQPAVQLPVSHIISSVVSHLTSSLPSTSYAAVPGGQAHSSQEEPVFDAESCECSNHTAKMEKNGWTLNVVAGYMSSA